MKFVPAPWHLTGKGYIFIYKLDSDFVNRFGEVPGFLNGKFAGGLASVMLVDYASSDAGPYGELLFIPGKFNHRGKKLNTISKIYVSTIESVVNGRKNWGIPKEQADFLFSPLDSQRERVQVSAEGTIAADFLLKAWGPSFPLSTSLLPFPLVQENEENYYYTSFSGKGEGRLVKLENLSVNPSLFPDLSLKKPLAIVKADPFEITFPAAIVEKKDT